MKVINGKLLGQSKSDLDVFQEYQNQYNLEIDSSIDQIEKRLNKAENTLRGEALREALLRRVEAYVQQIEQRCDCLEKEQRKLHAIEQRCEYLEKTKLSQIESNLLKVRKLIPHKLLWLTFGSSIVVGIISLSNFLAIFPSQNQPQELKYNLSYPNLIESKDN